MATDDNKDFGFSEKQRARFLEHGYLRLGHVLTETELSALQQRIDEIMMGQVCYQHMRMQLLDPESGQLRRTMGHKVACLAYRRIDDLEQDPTMKSWRFFRFDPAQTASCQSDFQGQPEQIAEGTRHQHLSDIWD